LSRQEDQCEETAHTVPGSNAHIFDIQALFLIKAIAVFDPAAQPPIFVDLLDAVDGLQRDIGDQDQLLRDGLVIGD
jgi:hypothetical protein